MIINFLDSSPLYAYFILYRNLVDQSTLFIFYKERSKNLYRPCWQLFVQLFLNFPSNFCTVVPYIFFPVQSFLKFFSLKFLIDTNSTYVLTALASETCIIFAVFWHFYHNMLQKVKCMYFFLNRSFFG